MRWGGGGVAESRAEVGGRGIWLEKSKIPSSRAVISSTRKRGNVIGAALHISRASLQFSTFAAFRARLGKWNTKASPVEGLVGSNGGLDLQTNDTLQRKDLDRKGLPLSTTYQRLLSRKVPQRGLCHRP